MRVPHDAQGGVQLRLRIISGIAHSALSDRGRPQVTESAGSKSAEGENSVLAVRNHDYSLPRL